MTLTIAYEDEPEADPALLAIGEPVSEVDPEEGTDEDPHWANLALDQDDGALSILAEKLSEAIEQDIECRAPWRKRYEQGMKNLGFDESEQGTTDTPFEGASMVRHPLLAEAGVEFQARAMGELWPPDGPVNTKIVGDATPDLEEQAQRKKDHMNWQLTAGNPDIRREFERALMMLPYEGTVVLKIYWDEEVEGPAFEYIPGETFFIPYGARSFHSASRKGYELELEPHEIRARQTQGLYRDDIEIGPSDAVESGHDAASRSDSIEGRERPSTGLTETTRVREVHCILDLSDCGIDVGDEGDLPYIVHMTAEDPQILAIYRNWWPDDERARPIKAFVDIGFLPWRGVYSLGLIHMIGGLEQAATASLRSLLDAAAFSNLQGGVKAKSGIDGKSLKIAPGHFEDVDTNGVDDIRKAIMAWPFKEPSSALFSLLGLLVDSGRRFASIADIQTGEGNPNAPVGTTVALIEQASKVFKEIHARLHHSEAEILSVVVDLNRRYLSDEEIFDRFGRLLAYRQDYEGPVDVVPVSDPRIFSSAQRIALAQSVYQLAMQSPDMDRREATRRLLVAMNVPDPDALMPPEDEAQPLDPVSENAVMMVGRPIKVFPHQDDAAHIKVHEALIPMLQASGVDPKEIEQRAGPLMAHLTEHRAQLYRKTLAQQMGIQLPQLGNYTDRQSPLPAIPPELDMMIAQAAAQASAQILQSLPKPPEQQQAEMDMQVRMAELQVKQGELQVKQAEVQRKVQDDQRDHQVDVAKLQQDAEEARRDREHEVRMKTIDVAEGREDAAREAVEARRRERERVMNAGADGTPGGQGSDSRSGS